MERTTYALIPARGGSKGIIRKNLLPIDGVPLFIRAAQKAAEFAEEVYVSSDSQEILAIAELHGFTPWWRKAELADDEATVDDVVKDFRRDHPGELLVWQPTVVMGTSFSVGQMIEVGRNRNEIVALGVPVHGVWVNGLAPLRLNRQLTDSQQMEIGVRFYPEDAREGSPDSLYDHWANIPIVDIDTWVDYEHALQIVDSTRWQAPTVVYEPIVGPNVGLGHLYRCLALMEVTQGWKPKLVPRWADDADPKFQQKVAEIVERHGFKLTTSWLLDPSLTGIWVLDVLDTDRTEVFSLKAREWKVVTFEDHGMGALSADLVINALYANSHLWTDRYHSQIKSGAEWAVIRPEFMVGGREWQTAGNTVLVTFGGTDPDELTDKVTRALSTAVDLTVRVVEPPASGTRGPTVMASEMAQADVIVCSGGRTVLEAAAMGKPAVVLCQNFREQTHTHLGEQHGNISLGLGRWAKEEDILDAVYRAIEMNGELRKNARASVDGRGTERIVEEFRRLMK